MEAAERPRNDGFDAEVAEIAQRTAELRNTSAIVFSRNQQL